MKYIIGVDEVGLGSWCGPLLVCAVAVPEGWTLSGLTDSKKLTKEDHARLYPELYKLPSVLVESSSEAIDEHGPRVCLVGCHSIAIYEMLRLFPQAEVIVDGNVPLPLFPKARLVPKADSLFPAVSAASVIAKYNRDEDMRDYHAQYPHWGFDTGAGYGTARHEAGLAAHGMTPWHRRSYEPMKSHPEWSRPR